MGPVPSTVRVRRQRKEMCRGQPPSHEKHAACIASPASAPHLLFTQRSAYSVALDLLRAGGCWAAPPPCILWLLSSGVRAVASAHHPQLGIGHGTMHMPRALWTCFWPTSARMYRVTSITWQVASHRTEEPPAPTTGAPCLARPPKWPAVHATWARLLLCVAAYRNCP